jgi:hypothetical protein
MAEIYASSQLTIIAAAGDHANHGLAGIHRGSHSHPNRAVVGSVQLLGYPAPLDIHKLLYSKWASRAWTFQECFFARRRLFFANDQVKYVCNCSPTKMRSTGWIPFASPEDAGQTDEFLHARKIVRGYTGRQLTYESDALIAIVSALNSLRDGNVRHLWGLPLRSTSPDQEQGSPDVELSLLWRHDEPCSRQGRIPSWSPIAWTGKITWFPSIKANTYGIRLLDYPESTTAVPWTTAYAPNDFESTPRYFEITAKMAHLGLIRTSLHVRGERTLSDQPEQATFLTFSLENNLDIILARPLSDVDLAFLNPTAPIIGILLDPGTQASRIYGLAILLVQRVGTSYYERIGILKLGSALNYSHELFLHSYRNIRFVNRATGEVSFYYCGDLSNMDDVNSKDIRLSFLEKDKWETFFAEGTIVLG